MSSADSDRIDTKARAIETALARVGEPITEAQAKEIAALEECECKQGMFALAPSRRALLGGAGIVAAAGMTMIAPRASNAKAPPGAVEYPVQADATKEAGRMMEGDGGHGSRSQVEGGARWANPAQTATIPPSPRRHRTL